MAALLRPSAAPRWRRCPGSVALASPIVDAAGESLAREQGVAAHWVAQQLGQDGVLTDLGTVAPNGVVVDEDMLNAANIYVDHNVRTMGAGMQVEQHVVCDVIHPECAGTPDAYAVSYKDCRVYVSDLKYGRRLVEADSDQLVVYAAGIANNAGLPLERVEVHLTVYQPRLYHPDGPMRTVVMRGNYFVSRVRALQIAAAQAMSPEAPCAINPYCRHCPGRAQCPALREAALDSAELVGKAIATGLPPDVVDQELRFLRHAQFLIESYATGLQAVAEHQIRSGHRSTVFELRSEPGRLQWRENAVAFLQRYGPQVLKPAELKTPTQLKKVLGDEVVSLFSERTPGAAKLQEINMEKLNKRFGA